MTDGMSSVKTAGCRLSQTGTGRRRDGSVAGSQDGMMGQTLANLAAEYVVGAKPKPKPKLKLKPQETEWAVTWWENRDWDCRISSWKKKRDETRFAGWIDRVSYLRDSVNIPVYLFLFFS